MGSDLTQPTSTSLFPATSRFVPIAKEFLCTVFVFFDCQQNNLYQPVSPICLVASYLWVVDQYVTCASIRELFPQRYY
jgi:hypothetical protein